MGSTGSSKSDSQYVNAPSNDENDISGVATFPDETDGWNVARDTARDWFANSENSNYTEWVQGLTDPERVAVAFYTDSGYDDLNRDLYETPWDEMSDNLKRQASNLYQAINKFELNQAIEVTRITRANFIFPNVSGRADESYFYVDTVRKALEDNPYKQFNGFQSASTGYKPVFGGNLVIHYTIPAAKGVGAWVDPISENSGEREFVINTNAVVKFDPSSVRLEDGIIHVNAQWLGQAQDQAFGK